MRSSCLAALFLALLLAPRGARADKDAVGEALNVLLPLGALSATVLYEEGHQGTWQFLKSAATAEVITELLKETIDKEQPNGGCCTSFPSGHATRAFYAAGFIHHRYGRRWAIPSYALATFVAYARTDTGSHDEVDVLAGALIGWLSSRYFTTPHRDATLRPMSGAPGLVFEYRF